MYWCPVYRRCFHGCVGESNSHPKCRGPLLNMISLLLPLVLALVVPVARAPALAQAWP